MKPSTDQPVAAEKHNAGSCEVCAAQQEAEAVGAIPIAGHEPVATKSAAHSDWCARWVTESVAIENRPMLGRLYDATVPCSCGAEPVVAERRVACIANSAEVAIDLKHTYENGCELAMTGPVAGLPACLCGLDTNPTASPRMDIHCPKHDAPGSEPELLPDQVVAMIKESVDCEYSDLVGYKARLGAALVDLKLLLNSRVSQPAGEPSDVLVSRAEAARAVCFFCADTNRYEAPQRMEGSTRLWHHDKMNSNHGVEQCHAAAILALLAAQPSSTPADDEQADNAAWLDAEIQALRDAWRGDIRAHQDGCPASFSNCVPDDCGCGLTELRNKEMDVIATGRARGTPTTDARERAKAIALEVYEVLAVNDDVNRWHREPILGMLTDLFTKHSALSSTPSDKVAQRARATAKEIHKRCDEELPNIPNDSTSYAPTTEEIVAIILKHFTATDVEQGTCTWTCEPNPDIEMRETDCGNAFQFEVGGPTENKMKFCCYCGKQLAEKIAERREGGEGDG